MSGTFQLYSLRVDDIPNGVSFNPNSEEFDWDKIKPACQKEYEGKAADLLKSILLRINIAEVGESCMYYYLVDPKNRIVEELFEDF